MFPPDNLDPQSKQWANYVQDTVQDLETSAPRLTADLDMLRKESSSVITEVSSNVNAYYTATLAQYPNFQRVYPMLAILGNSGVTRSLSNVASTSVTTVETWTTVFSQTLTTPSAVTALGVRLNTVQFRVVGPNGYYLRYRWVVGGITEGINSARWMSRRSNSLTGYSLSTSGNTPNVFNRYAHWSGSATSSFTLSLQANIVSDTSRDSAVAAQNVLFLPYTDSALTQPAYLDVMVTI